MKSVFITFDQAFFERIMALLDRHNCRGIITIIDEAKVAPLLEALHRMDKETEQLGLRAFVWNIEQTI